MCNQNMFAVLIVVSFKFLSDIFKSKKVAWLAI